MCISPKSSRSGNITNINSFINPKNANKNNNKEDSVKYSKKKLSSRNNEMLKAPKKNIYKKILPNSILQFSSNNSTSTNTTSNFNNIKSHNHNNFDYDTNSYKNPEYFKGMNKPIKNQNQNNANNNTREKIDNFLQRYKNKMKNSMSNSTTDIMRGHNRSLSKNLNQELIISKIVDKLVAENINKINKYNIELNQQTYKNEIEKNLFGSMTTKEYNPYTNKNKINFLMPPTYKNVISINNVKSPGLNRHSALASSTMNIYSKKINNQTNTNINFNKPKRPNSNDNMKNIKIQKKNNSKPNYKPKMSLSKSKDIINKTNYNNFSKKQKNLSNGVGLNNNQIEYVQINLFNGGNDEKLLKEGKNLIFNKFEKKRNQYNNKKKQKNKEKEVKLFDSDINYSNDGNYLTNTCLSFNEKSRQNKEVFTPEENHFQAVNYVQLIKNNDKKFG
jgi:hypothetical protein